MTFDEIQRGGILSADERSADFDERRLGVSLDEKDIGKMKKKVRQPGPGDRCGRAQGRFRPAESGRPSS